MPLAVPQAGWEHSRPSPEEVGTEEEGGIMAGAVWVGGASAVLVRWACSLGWRRREGGGATTTTTTTTANTEEAGTTAATVRPSLILYAVFLVRSRVVGPSYLTFCFGRPGWLEMRSSLVCSRRRQSRLRCCSFGTAPKGCSLHCTGHFSLAAVSCSSLLAASFGLRRHHNRT